jgi:ATP-dependent Clp protease ATP-binding subunit ClpB
MGPEFGSLIDRSKQYKSEFGDSFVSVEHILLSLLQDNRIGKRIISEFNLTEGSLREAILAIRGTQKVTDQSNKHSL